MLMYPFMESVARLDMTHKWDMTKVNLRRGEWLGPINIRLKYHWPCKDGYVMWNYWAGPAATLWTRPFVEWMIQEGAADDFIKSINWEEIDASTEEGVKQVEEILSRVTEQTVNFFMKHTKDELSEEAKKRDLMLYPVANVKDVLESKQLASRGFWENVEHPELDALLTYPGALAISSESEAIPGINRRAPLIGEHNEEIYIDELGISGDRLSELRRYGII